MGIILQNNAETGTNGVDVDTTNSGGVNNDAWTLVGGTGFSPPAYSNTQVSEGTLSYKLTGFSGIQPSLEWDVSPNKTTLYLSLRMYFPGAVFDVQSIYFTRLGSICSSLVLAGGKFTLLDDVGNTVATSTTSAVANQWMRIEYKTVASTTTGSIQARIYLNENATTPTETISANASTNTTIDHVTFFGQFDTPDVLYYDTFVVRDDRYPDPPYSKMTTAWLKF